MKRLVLLRRCIVSLFAVLSLFLHACLEELKDADKIATITLSPTVEFPLIASDFTFTEFLTEGKTTGAINNSTGLLVLTYKDTLLSEQANKIFFVPNQQSPKITITGPSIVFPSPGGVATVSQSKTFTFQAAQGEKFDSIWFNAGSLTMNVISTLPAQVAVTLSIPSFKKQGQPFLQTVTFTGATNQHPVFDISGTSLDLTKGGTTTNSLTFFVSATVHDTGGIIGTTNIQVDFALKNLQFKGLFGRLGTHDIALPEQTTNIDIFNNVEEGTFRLEEPSLLLDIDNSFGFSSQLDIGEIEAVKENGDAVPLQGSAIQLPLNPYSIAGPSLQDLGEIVTTPVVLNAGNSNVADLIEALPHDLHYQFSGKLNPSNTAGNFVLDTSRLTVRLGMELPFYGRVSGLALTKTIDFEGLGIDGLQEATLRLSTINGFALDVHLQGYFVDDNDHVLDSLFTDGTLLMKAASVNAEGEPTASTELTREVPLSRERLDRINTATALRINAIISTINNGTTSIKIISDQRLRVKVGVSAKVEYSVN